MFRILQTAFYFKLQAVDNNNLRFVELLYFMKEIHML